MRRKTSPERLPVGRATLVNPLLTCGVVLVLLVLAEIATRLGWVSGLILPPPTQVVGVLVGGFRDGLYLSALWATLWPTAIGFLVTALVAVAVGALLGSVPRLESVFMPLIFALESTPKIAIAPLIVLWFGFGPPGKIVVVVVVTFFPVVVNTLAGMRIPERERVDLVAAMGATRFQLLRYIRLPNALPYIFAGFHVGIIFSLIGAVVAEFVGSQSGLGYVLLQQKALFNVPGVFASIVLLMVCGIVLDRLVTLVERRVVFWAKDTSRTAV